MSERLADQLRNIAFKSPYEGDIGQRFTDRSEEDKQRFQKLLMIGREKGIVTQKDVERVYPELQVEEEPDEGLMHEVYSGLISAGILHEDEEVMTDRLSFETISPDANRDILENIDVDDSLGMYMKSVGQVPLLTLAQEVALSKRIERGRKASERMAVGTINRKQISHLRKNIEDGSSARDHLLAANTRLVFSIAKKYKYMVSGVPIEDLNQEGAIGLMRAVKKYDYRRGHKFSTYATWWIRQAVNRAIANQGRTVRLPVYIFEQISRLKRTDHNLTQKFGRDPTDEELAAAQGVTVGKVEHLLNVAQPTISLSTPLDNAVESELGDFIEDVDEKMPSKEVAQLMQSEQLQGALQTLSHRESLVLKLRYGLKDGQSYTLEQIGQKFGVTRERIRQIESKALERLRHPLNRRLFDGILKD